MKKTIAYLLIIPLAGLFSACNREEKNLFDGSAAERLQKSIATTKGYLIDAPTGWEMLYFPYPESAGYVLLCKFESNGKVTIGAKNRISSNDQFKTEESLWNIDGTQSTTLSFHSYNSLLSIFADPLSDGVGYNGDYEFVVLDSKADKLKLKGKKNGAYIEMNRLNDTQDWKAYYESIDQFNEYVFLGNDGIEMTYTNGDTVMTLTYEDGLFSYPKNNVDTTLGTILTPSGLRFYSNAPNSIGARDFTLSEDMSKLVCKTDDHVVIASSLSNSDFFDYKFTKKARWAYSAEGSDYATVAAVDAIKVKASAHGATLSQIAYERLASVNMKGQKKYTYALFVSYLVEDKVFEGHINLNYVNKDGKVTFTYSSTDASLDKLLLRVGDSIDETQRIKEGARLFTDIFCDIFVPISYSGSQLNMVQMILESQNTTGKKILVIADTKTL